MAQVIAILNGLESKESLNLSDSYIQERYNQAYDLVNNGYYVIKTQYGYSIKLHAPKWTRRVR